MYKLKLKNYFNSFAFPQVFAFNGFISRSGIFGWRLRRDTPLTKLCIRRQGEQQIQDGKPAYNAVCSVLTSLLFLR